MEERYNYREHITKDIIDYIKCEYSSEEIAEKLKDRDEWETDLNDDLWDCDIVTGNASGSYYCNAWKAEEALCHNWDLLADAIEEFEICSNFLRSGPEACDVTIRCYLLGECIYAALDQLEKEQEAAQ